MLHVRDPRPHPDRGRLLSVTTVLDAGPGRVIIEVVGEVDACTTPALDICLHSQAIQPGLRELVIDMGRVTFLGAAGVRVLAQADRRCGMRGARLVIRSDGRRAVLLPLELTGLTDVIAVDPIGADRARPR